jgi:NADP-dependent 3-hydroxy acid dehydrogenase YdfG
MTVPLKDKVVLITGASSGFGEDAALLFAEQGCKVVAAARRVERLQALVEKIQSRGGEALAIPVDVADRADIENMVQAALDLYGRIDILFNNAGFGRLDWLEKLDPERDIETLVRVNLLGVIHTTRAVLPHMLERRQGHIINMSSMAGLIAAPRYTAYSATKFGVRAFTEALRREVRHLGIHVTGIFPGPAVTEFDEHTGEKGQGLFTHLGFILLSSQDVAWAVVRAARHPVRTVVIPGWFRILTAINAVLPWAVDLFLEYTYTRSHHKIEERPK